MATIANDGNVPERKVGFLLGVGIFVIPYIFVWFLLRKGHSTLSRVIGFGWLAFVILVTASVNHAGQKAVSASNNAPTTANEGSLSTSASSESKDGQPATTSKWSYQDTSDKMRGTKGRIASIDANEELDFDFPFNGGSTASLNLRRDRRGQNVYLRVSKGQFLCNSFSNSSVAVRFDGGPIKQFSCSDTADGSSDTIFLNGESKFVSELKHAKHVTIEAMFFQAGAKQMSFDTAGLDWN